MHVESTALGRLRSRTASPATLRRLSVSSVVGLYLVVTTGAVVRLTGSGLGCDHWPRCGSTPLPIEAKGGHSVIEFSNRVVALVAVGLALAAWIAARRTPGAERGLRRLAGFVFLGSFLEIPLGGLVIVTGLSAGLVMVHFLLAVAMLGLAVAVANEALRLDLGASEPLVPPFLRRAGLALAAAACGLVVTGAFATASGPHPGAEKEIKRVFTVEGTVYVHVRLTAVFGVVFLATLLVVAWRRQWRLLVVAGGLLALLLVQMAVGEVQYRRGLPWWLVLIHVSLAAAVWAWTAGLVVSLWRPVAALRTGT